MRFKLKFYYHFVVFFVFFFFEVQTQRLYGVTFGSGEWSNPAFPYNSSGAFTSLDRVKSTGANWVRILVTWFQDSINSTTIYPINTPSPLASQTDEQLMIIITQAHNIGLKVMLSPILDPNWELPWNGRDSQDPNFVWRGMIGQNFNNSQWINWFASYSNYILHMAQIAKNNSVELFCIASELLTAFKQDAQWVTIIQKIKAVYNGNLTVATTTGTSPNWWSELDYIGIDAYYILNTTSTKPNVSELVAAWQPIIAELINYTVTFKKPILFTEVGYTSAYYLILIQCNCYAEKIVVFGTFVLT